MLRLRLVALSFLLLFTELALIRWTGSNVVYLSYFSNFVLLGSFLGIGVGFLRAGRTRVELFPFAPLVLALFVGFVLAFPVSIDRSASRVIYFGDVKQTGLPMWVMLPIIFCAVAAVMALIADAVARTFARFEPLEAYRLDIAGSVLGIAAFSLLSFLGLPPLAWGGVAAVLFLALVGRRRVAIVTLLGCVLLVGLLGWESRFVWTEPLAVSWSPYYKIDVAQDGPQSWRVKVNGIPHQQITTVARRRRQEPIYFHPYSRMARRNLDRVLIVGAGTGTDVAIALAEGAKRVDAVEIDPRLYELGKELHPDHPYADPRVHVHIDDGRAFLERSHARWNLILFALPDSLTLVAGQSSLRLESYLFTLEAMRTARAHLAAGGTFAMYNYYRKQWLVDRLARTLQLAYGRAPCFDTVGSVTRHLALLADGNVRCARVWSADGRVVPPPARDDYPFLYLQTRTIPPLYLVTLGLVLALSLVLVRAAGGTLGGIGAYADLFLMGVAFLLLETKNVVQFALLFGTTWFVNALVFGGILLTVLLAVEVARHVRLRASVLYAALLVTLVVAWLVPQHSLLSLPFVPRLAAAVALAFAPIFVANLVFAERFRNVGASTVAFGANLLGAMLGGVLEYSALVFGYRSLLIVVAALYALAFATRPGGVLRRVADSAAGDPAGVTTRPA